MTWIYLSLGILCFLSFSQGKPNGSPAESCFYMTPRHIHPHTYRKVFPTRAMGLYNITTSSDIFRPDRPIRVTLWGPPFKGFMMVAAEEGAKDWPTGIFYSDDGSAKRLSCLARGDTVTHQNNSYKDSVSVLWYGPENMMSEQIQFVATVVVNLTIYYTSIKSGFLRLDPTLSAARAGGENGPVAVTMDPWLSGNSATRPPVNWYGGGTGGGRGGGLLGSLGSLLGNGGSSGSSGGRGGVNRWGSGSNWQQWGDGSVTSRSTWSNSGGGSSWGGSGTGTGQGSSWGNSGTGTGQGSSWGNSGGTGTGQGSSWGGTGTATGQGSSWGSGGTGTGTGQSSSWGSGGTGTGQSSSWGGSSGNSWGSSGSSWGSPSSGNTWDSSSGSSWGASSSSGSSGSAANKPSAGGSSIWTWNSGPSTQAPPSKTTKAPPASANAGSTAWSVDTLINLLKQLTSSGTATTKV